MSGRVRNRRRASPTAESKSESRSRSRSRSVSKRTRSRSKSKSRGGEIGEPKSPAPLLRVYEEGSSDFEEEANARKERLTYEQKRQKSYEARKKVLVSATSPIHVSCINSPLDSTMADSQNYRGLLNLAFIILFVSQVRLVIENLLKYGILFLQVPSLQGGYVFWLKSWPCLATGVLLVPLQPLLAHAIENYLPARATPTQRDALHALNCLAGVVIPTVVIEGTNAAHISGVALLMFTLCGVLKLTSYAHVMHCNRLSAQPQAAALSQVLYFMAAPTLCFQFSYPRFPARIRKRFLFKRVAELLFCAALIFIIARQYVVPTLTNAMQYMEEGRWNWVGILERVIKLSIPNLIMFSVGFYALFHSYLNITAELLRFGDRVFYRDWWNSVNIREYWNRWNQPVHSYVLRHIYAPCKRAGYSVNTAQFVVFFCSAVLHEYVVSVPMHSVKLWAFVGMLLQAPLVSFGSLVQKLFGKTSVIGNVLFWVTFCVFGQPLIIMLYYHDAVKHNQNYQ